jgi:hypothetical protein
MARVAQRKARPPSSKESWRDEYLRGCAASPTPMAEVELTCANGESACGWRKRIREVENEEGESVKPAALREEMKAVARVGGHDQAGAAN